MSIVLMLQISTVWVHHPLSISLADRRGTMSPGGCGCLGLSKGNPACASLTDCPPYRDSQLYCPTCLSHQSGMLEVLQISCPRVHLGKYGPLTWMECSVLLMIRGTAIGELGTWLDSTHCGLLMCMEETNGVSVVFLRHLFSIVEDRLAEANDDGVT